MCDFAMLSLCNLRLPYFDYWWLHCLKSLFTFFLVGKSDKKIKAVNKKAEIYHISLKSRNSPGPVL